MRQGEILNLQWQDVDFTCGTLIVMKSKNGTRRTIPLNSTVFALLAAKQAATGASSGPVFKSPLGNTLQVRFLVREFCEARDRAGIPDFRFHEMRHTFATRLVQRGNDLYKVQRLLGHKTGTMTQRYAHHSPESLRDGVNVLYEVRQDRVSTKLYMDPAFAATTACHAMHQIKQGCVYIFGLSVDHSCVRALMNYARVLLISTTALVGPTICPGSERAGCPSGVITDRPRCTPWCESL
jgi:Phage integrase family